MKKPAIVLWLTGLPCSGKTTLSNEIARRYKAQGIEYHQLDGDIVRNTYISKGIGYSWEERKAHLLRIAEIAKILKQHNINVICSFVSPYENVRNMVRKIVGKHFILVYLDCDKETCMRRDLKGLWLKAYKGEIKHFTGIDDPYEIPKRADIVVKTADHSVAKCTDIIWNNIQRFYA